MKSIEEIKLEGRISDILLEFAEISQRDNLTTSDLQGIAIVKAIEIIELVRGW